LRNCRLVLIIFLQPRLLCFFSTLPPPTSSAMCRAPAAPTPPFLTPRVAPAYASPLYRPPLALPSPLHVAPPPPEPPRVPPALPAPAHARNASLGLKACSAAAPRPSLLTQTLHFPGISLFRPPRLTGPSPPLLATIDSHPRHFPSPVQYSQSITVTPCSSLTHPISFSRTRASFPAAPASLSSAAARPRRRPDATSPLSPNQRHQQHYIIPQKRSGHSLTALRHPSQQNAVPPSPPVRTRAASPSTTPFRPTSGKIRYGNRTPHLHGAHACPIHPRSPAPHREHRCSVTAAANPRRRPCSTTCPSAHHPPLSIASPVSRVGPVFPRPNPHRRREHAG
jgi:hypothetical protein